MCILNPTFVTLGGPEIVSAFWTQNLASKVGGLIVEETAITDMDTKTVTASIEICKNSCSFCAQKYARRWSLFWARKMDTLPFVIIKGGPKIVTVFRSQNQARKLGQNLQKNRCKLLEFFGKMLTMHRCQARSRTQWDPFLLKLKTVTAWRSQNEARAALPQTPPQTPVSDTDNLQRGHE